MYWLENRGYIVTSWGKQYAWLTAEGACEPAYACVTPQLQKKKKKKTEQQTCWLDNFVLISESSVLSTL